MAPSVGVGKVQRRWRPSSSSIWGPSCSARDQRASMSWRGMASALLLVMFVSAATLWSSAHAQDTFRCKSAADCRGSDGFAYCNKYRGGGTCDCSFSRMRHGSRCDKVCTDNGRRHHCGHGVCRYDDNDWLLSIGFCNCSAGWQLDYNYLCNDPVCTVPCQNGGWCSAPDRCICRSGYSGNYCQIKHTCAALPAPDYGFTEKKTIQGLQTQLFSCPRGFKLKGSAIAICEHGRWNVDPPPTCQDYDECYLQTHNCGECEICLNAEPSFTCARPPGMSGWVFCEELGRCCPPSTVPTDAPTDKPLPTLFPVSANWTPPIHLYWCTVPPPVALPKHGKGYIYSKGVVVDGSRATAETIAELTCDEGFEPAEEALLLCLLNGDWHPLVREPSCVASTETTGSMGHSPGSTVPVQPTQPRTLSVELSASESSPARDSSTLVLIISLAMIGIVVPTIVIVTLICVRERRRSNRYSAPAKMKVLEGTSSASPSSSSSSGENENGSTSTKSQTLESIYVDTPSALRLTGDGRSFSALASFRRYQDSPQLPEDREQSEPQHYASRDVLTNLPSAAEPRRGSVNSESQILSPGGVSDLHLRSPTVSVTPPRVLRLPSEIARHHSNSTEVTTCSSGSYDEENSGSGIYYQDMVASSTHTQELKKRTSSSLTASPVRRPRNMSTSAIRDDQSPSSSSQPHQHVRRSSEPTITVRNCRVQLGKFCSSPRRHGIPPGVVRSTTASLQTKSLDRDSKMEETDGDASSKPGSAPEKQQLAGRGQGYDTVISMSDNASVDSNQYERMDGPPDAPPPYPGADAQSEDTPESAVYDDTAVLPDDGDGYASVSFKKKADVRSSPGKTVGSPPPTGLKRNLSSGDDDAMFRSGSLLQQVKDAFEKSHANDNDSPPWSEASPAWRLAGTERLERAGTLPRGFGRDRHKRRPSDMPALGQTLFSPRSASSRDVTNAGGYANTSDIPSLSVENRRLQAEQQQRVQQSSSQHISALRQNFHRLSTQQFQSLQQMEKKGNSSILKTDCTPPSSPPANSSDDPAVPVWMASPGAAGTWTKPPLNSSPSVRRGKPFYVNGHARKPSLSPSIRGTSELLRSCSSPRKGSSSSTGSGSELQATTGCGSPGPSAKPKPSPRKSSSSSILGNVSHATDADGYMRPHD